jgi:hypothetical protein
MWRAAILKVGWDPVSHLTLCTLDIDVNIQNLRAMIGQLTADLGAGLKIDVKIQTLISSH